VYKPINGFVSGSILPIVKSNAPNKRAYQLMLH